MLALHRSARSDLFFEGIVTESGPSSFCKVRFTEGRAKGQSIKVYMPEKLRVPERVFLTFSGLHRSPSSASSSSARGDDGLVAIAFARRPECCCVCVNPCSVNWRL